MSRLHRQDLLLDNPRFLLANIALIIALGILSLRLWYIQIYKGDFYRRISENNRLRRIEIQAPRGIIYDRDERVILGNRPFYDLVLIPQYVLQPQTTLMLLSELLHEPIQTLERPWKQNRGRPKFMPITLKRNLTLDEVSIIESNKMLLPGIDINVAPRRDYKKDIPSHVVGYVSEISASSLRDLNQLQPNLYQLGDLIGKQGIESKWEEVLRGQRGHRVIQVDAFGRQTNLFEEEGWELPAKPAIAGSDVTLTLDIELQKAVKKAFQGKYGSIIALNPSNGEILAMLSAPDFDPAIYQDGISQDAWLALINDPYKPLFDKSTGGAFSPGSIYKPIIAFAALVEGIITPHTKHFCPGHYELGRDVFHCHKRTGHGKMDIGEALIHSCDVFFYHIGVELGIDRIAKYAKDFGLGEKLGVNLNLELPGLIPTTQLKKQMPHLGVAAGDTPNIAIGQGANLLTPIQIASLYATIANGGKVWRPYIVKKVINHLGEITHETKPHLIKETSLISPAQFALLQKYLGQVVSDPQGTGRQARVEDHTVAGKTGSVQVVSLKKNRNRQSIVSMKWQEHAMFAAFSPVDNPELVVVIISENDRAGGGGAAAAPIASEIIDVYWKLKAKKEPQSPAS